MESLAASPRNTLLLYSLLCFPSAPSTSPIYRMLQDYMFAEDQEEGVVLVDLLDGVYYIELYQVVAIQTMFFLMRGRGL